jgi:hypothetical protein
MRLGFGLGVEPRRRVAMAPVATAEALLGQALLAMWDAGRGETLTLDGGLVSGWQDSVGGITLSASGGERPVLDGFGVTFAGGQVLSLAGMPLPIGTVPLELWLVADQTGPGFDPSVLVAMGETMVGALDTGNGADLFALTSDLVLSGEGFAGQHVARVVLGSEAVRVDVDGAAGAAVAAPPTASNGPLRFGADGAEPPGSFFTGSLKLVLVTVALSDPQAAALSAMLMARLSA